MTADDRFDQLLRASLDWQAGRVARTQPTVHQAAARVAERVRPDGQARPRLSLVPATAASLNLWTLVLMLLALLAALYLGTRVPTPEPPPELRFGYPVDCPIPRHSGLQFEAPENQVVLAIFAPDGPDDDVESDFFSLHADGRFVQDISNPGETRADTITGARVAVRVLSAQGVEKLLERVAEAEFTPGCRTLATDGASGTLTAWPSDGPTDVSWGPDRGTLSRQISAQDEAYLEALVAELARPEAWLAGDLWIAPTEQVIEPDHWLITLEFRPSGHQSGDVVELPAGTVLDGSDHRPSLLPLPGGAEPETFGAEIDVGDGSESPATIRCGPASLDEAVALSVALDEITNGEGLGTDGPVGDVFSADLATSIVYGIQPIYGAGYDCATLAADRAWMTTHVPTISPSPVIGDLADVDPCGLVTPAASSLLGADASEARPARLPLGLAARACVIFDSTVPTEPVDGAIDPLPGGYKARVTLYPIGVDADTAGDVVAAAFGDGLPRETIAGSPLWVITDCSVDAFFCQPAFAAWSGSRLVIVELAAAEDARAFVEAVLTAGP